MTRKRLMSEESQKDDFHAPLEEGSRDFLIGRHSFPHGPVPVLWIQPRRSHSRPSERADFRTTSTCGWCSAWWATITRCLTLARSFASTALSVINEFCREFRAVPRAS